jgi:hypothetical protein
MDTQIIYYPAPETVLSREEIALAVGAALDGNPKLLQAFRQLLAQHLAAATSEAAQSRMSEREAGHAGGRLAEILGLQHELANYVKAASEIRGGETGRLPGGQGRARR